MRRRTRIIIIVVLTLVLVASIVAAVLGYNYWQRTYIIVNKEVIRRDVTTLDVHGQDLDDLTPITELKQLQQLNITDTGITPEQYLQLQEALPQCAIAWSVPFQDGYLPCDSTTVTITQLSKEDIDLLSYLPLLETVDASACFDYDALLLLKEQYPEVAVRHSVFLSGKEYPLNVAELVVNDATVEEMYDVLPHLSSLRKVTLTGNVPDNEAMYGLKITFPQITFVWSFEVCGVPVTSTDTELYLNEIPIESADVVEQQLKYFYNLKWVEMCKCGIPSEEMARLGRRHPETRFVWTVYVGRIELRTDVKVFMPYKYGYRTSQFNDSLTEELKYCTDIICMDLGHMGVQDYSFLENMTNMQYLILADTTGFDFSYLANLTELKYLEIFITNIYDLEVLTGLTKLEDLNLSYTYPYDYEPLTRMTWLKNLWLVGPSWRLTYKERQMLIEGLPDTYIQFSGKGSVCGHWRKLPNYYAMRDLVGMPYYSGDPE